MANGTKKTCKCKSLKRVECWKLTKMQTKHRFLANSHHPPSFITPLVIIIVINFFSAQREQFSFIFSVFHFTNQWFASFCVVFQLFHNCSLSAFRPHQSWIFFSVAFFVTFFIYLSFWFSYTIYLSV